MHAFVQFLWKVKYIAEPRCDCIFWGLKCYILIHFIKLHLNMTFYVAGPEVRVGHLDPKDPRKSEKLSCQAWKYGCGSSDR